jgi:hypothetical protein
MTVRGLDMIIQVFRDVKEMVSLNIWLFLNAAMKVMESVSLVTFITP